MSPLTLLSRLEHRQAGHMAVGPLIGWRTRIKFETEVCHLKGIEARLCSPWASNVAESKMLMAQRSMYLYIP